MKTTITLMLLAFVVFLISIGIIVVVVAGLFKIGTWIEYRSYKKLYKTVVNEEIEETKELAHGVSPDFKIGESDDYGL
jgi:nucleoside recognition membrane protein YjiH